MTVFAEKPLTFNLKCGKISVTQYKGEKLWLDLILIDIQPLQLWTKL